MSGRLADELNAMLKVTLQIERIQPAA
jgi:hypothetical protein